MLDTILIVDGDASQLQMAKHAITEKLKYKAIIAATASEAIKMALSDEAPPSLMLLDTRLPQIDATHIISTVKHHKPELPIIILTEYGNNAFAVEAIHAGANDFLTKPVSIERLGLSIASALRIRYLSIAIENLEKQLAGENPNTAKSKTQIADPFNVFSSVPFSDGKVKKLRALEEDAIRFALNVCGGSMSKAARSLGIGRSTLYRKIGELERHRNNIGYISRENQTTRPMMVASDREHS